MSFEKLDQLGRRLSALEHASAILGADEATHMAVGALNRPATWTQRHRRDQDRANHP